jgi:hypothetical protein
MPFRASVSCFWFFAPSSGGESLKLSYSGRGVTTLVVYGQSALTIETMRIDGFVPFREQCPMPILAYGCQMEGEDRGQGDIGYSRRLNRSVSLPLCFVFFPTTQVLI